MQPIARMTSLGSVTVSIWPLAVSNARLDALDALLSHDERERAARMRAKGAAEEFTVSRGVARELLAVECNCPPREIVFSFSPRGKPALEGLNSTIAFNLSHSGGYCVLATCSAGNIGVDIEAIRPSVGDLAQSVFSAREAAQFAAVAPADRMRVFFRGWVAKEAYLKATGAGLAGGLKTLELDLMAQPEIKPVAIKGDEAAPLNWQFKGFDVSEDIVGAIAIETGEAVEISIRHVDPEACARTVAARTV
jgi:4'-phosphopantetheinyl transferase